MRKLMFGFLFLVAAAAAAQQTPSADDIAHRTVDMLAGPAWDKARYIAFTFDVERAGKTAASFAQRWDRYTGDYRVSGKDRNGDDVIVVMNVNTKQGKAWKNGAAVENPADLLNFGYRRFINDTYWLLMPLKSLDPGVHREYAGEKQGACGQTYDVVHLSFDQGVGLTSADNYWMWVNRDTGLVDEWHMKLQGSKPDEEPARVVFHDFRRIGGLLLSTRREMPGENPTVIRLNDITVSSDVPKDAFAR